MKINEYEFVAEIKIPELIQYIEARNEEHAKELFLDGLRDYIAEHIFDNGDEYRDEILKFEVTKTSWEGEVSDDYFD